MTPLRYWWLDHPRLHRPALVLATLQALSVAAVCAAPQAAASTNSMVLDWTGLRDSYGVPIGNYYLAIASARDQIAAAAPDVGWNPDTWTAWLTHALGSMLANLAAANILTAEAGLFIGIVALALWLLKITISTYWLTVIGEIARAIAGAVIQGDHRGGVAAAGRADRGVRRCGHHPPRRSGPRLDHDRHRADHAGGLDRGVRRPARADVRAGRAAGVWPPRRVLRRGRRHPQRRSGRRRRRAGRLADCQPDHPYRARTVAAVELRARRRPGRGLRCGVVGRGQPWATRRANHRDGGLRRPCGGGLRPASRRHQHLGWTHFRRRRGTAGAVHGDLRVGGATSIGEGDLDEGDPAAVAVAGRHSPVRRNAAPPTWCGSSSGTASRCWSTSSTSA